jgi:hypothetical protein
MDKPTRVPKQLTAVRIDPADATVLNAIALDTGRSVASCIREAIKEWIRARARKTAKKAADTTPLF